MTATPPASATVTKQCVDSAAPKLCTIHQHYRHANHVRRWLGQAPLAYGYVAERHPARRDRILRYWTQVDHRTVARWLVYGPAIRWAGEPGPECVSNHEGSVTSVNPAGYFGKWQADVDFQRHYNLAAWQRYGTADHWPEREQDLMAMRGHAARGWSPWPNTAAACGLL